MTGEEAKSLTDHMRDYLSVRLLEMLEVRDRNIQDGAEDDKVVWLNADGAPVAPGERPDLWTTIEAHYDWPWLWMQAILHTELANGDAGEMLRLLQSTDYAIGLAEKPYGGDSDWNIAGRQREEDARKMAEVNAKFAAILDTIPDRTNDGDISLLADELEAWSELRKRANKHWIADE